MLETAGRSAVSRCGDVHNRMVRGLSGKLHHKLSEFVSYLAMKTGNATETSHDEPELTNIPEKFTFSKTKINLNCLVCTYVPSRL